MSDFVPSWKHLEFFETMAPKIHMPNTAASAVAFQAPWNRAEKNTTVSVWGCMFIKCTSFARSFNFFFFFFFVQTMNAGISFCNGQCLFTGSQVREDLLCESAHASLCPHLAFAVAVPSPDSRNFYSSGNALKLHTFTTQRPIAWHTRLNMMTCFIIGKMLHLIHA